MILRLLKKHFFGNVLFLNSDVSEESGNTLICILTV